MGQLTNLTSLNLAGTQISELPAWFSQLTNLTSLYLSETQISELPAWLSQLTNLTSLDFSVTQISKLPESLGQLTNLTSLDFSVTQISKLPESFGQLTNLTSLDFSETQISKLPESFGQLTKLTSLNLSRTQINTLPKTIASFSNIEELDLSDNTYDMLPIELLDLGLVFDFDSDVLFYGICLHNVELEEMDINIFRRPINEIRQYYEEMERGSAHLNEARVVFLGDRDAGKSSIIHRLIKGIHNPNLESTPGIAINEIKFQIGSEIMTAKIWDFGGDEIMHSMHEFFMRDNCVYIIVLDGRQDDRPDYWLEFVRRYANHSPVIIIRNKMEQTRQSIINGIELARRYQDIIPEQFEILEISCKEIGDKYDKCFNAFKETLIKTLTKTKGYRKRWAASWLSVKQQLEQMEDTHKNKRNYIEARDYIEYCEEAGISNTFNQDVLLRWLNELGIVFSYKSQSDFVVDDLRVLRPQWITNGIYKIITSSKAKDCKGLLSVDTIGDILKSREGGTDNSQTYRGQECAFVVGMMRQFNLSYPIGHKEFIPILTPPDEPTDVAEWDRKTDVIRFYIKYQGDVPNSFIPQLIVRMKEDVNTDRVWKKGGFFTNNLFQVEALVYADKDKINIIIDGNRDYAGHYLSIIRNHFATIKGMASIEFDEYIRYSQECGNEVKMGYLKLSRIIYLLTNGATEDFDDIAKCKVNLLKLLQNIVPTEVFSRLYQIINESNNKEVIQRIDILESRLRSAINDNTAPMKIMLEQLILKQEAAIERAIESNSARILELVNEQLQRVKVMDEAAFVEFEKMIDKAVKKKVSWVSVISNFVGFLGSAHTIAYAIDTQYLNHISDFLTKLFSCFKGLSG